MDNVTRGRLLENLPIILEFLSDGPIIDSLKKNGYTLNVPEIVELYFETIGYKMPGNLFSRASSH